MDNIHSSNAVFKAQAFKVLFMRFNIRCFFILFFLAFTGAGATAQRLIKLDKEKINVPEQSVAFYRDTTSRLTIKDVLALNKFKVSKAAIPSFYDTKNRIFWFRIKVHNTSNRNRLFLNIDYPILNNVTCYKVKNNEVIDSTQNGLLTKISERALESQSILFNLSMAQGDTLDLYLKIKSDAPLFLPMKIGTYENVMLDLSGDGALVAMYIGIIFALFFYNVFIYFTVRDVSYIYYVIYILFMGLTQITLTGYTSKFLWPQNPELTKYAIILFPAIAGISSLKFVEIFLETKKYYPRTRIVFNAFGLMYIIAVLLVLMNNFYASYRIIDVGVFVLANFGIIIAVAIARKGSRPAILFLISWMVLIIFAVAFSLRNFNVLPYNKFTSYLLFVGSALQAILLSIALADRINTYKREKETSQAEALRISLENEKLIKEQNIVLEERVNERTNELVETNQQLSKTLTDLKDAQLQLVEAEKMASLGQLTAGIAHEINNPINFVKSNIKPLNLDINDLFEVVDMYNELHNVSSDDFKQSLKKINQKQEEIDLDFVKNEIRLLIKGIEDGADRTAVIVRGLRTFSRLDEGELKTANVHDGLESTLVLLRNSMPTYLRIEKNFKSKGDIECFPGKLNQVFMNIINNSIQAIEEKPEKEETESIIISTLDVPGNKIEIRIKDSGTGMTEQVKHKIFEPFFTTKSVGVGTGLGMAIVFKIIEEHRGKIEVESEPGKGAEFILTLPHIHPVT